MYTINVQYIYLHVIPDYFVDNNARFIGNILPVNKSVLLFIVVLLFFFFPVHVPRRTSRTNRPVQSCKNRTYAENIKSRVFTYAI